MRHRIAISAWLAAVFMVMQWLAPAPLAPLGSSMAAVAGVNCTATITSITFGNLDSNSFLLVGGNINLQTTGYLTYFCTNTTPTAQTLTACISLGNPGGATARTLTGAGLLNLSYQIYQNAARTIPWGSKYQTTWGSPMAVTVTVPPNGTSAPTTVPMYAAVAANQGVLVGAGNYSANYSTSDVALDTVAGAIGNCTTASGGGSASAFSITATIARTCQVQTDPLDFPTAAGGDPSNATASTTVQVTCGTNTGYKVGLDNGKNFDGTNRRMRGGPTHGNYVSYRLYQNSAATTPWGNNTASGGNTVTGTTGNQTFTIYGKVNAAQGAAPPGVYFDAVTVYVYY